jgi:hypothetical protein
MRALLIALGVVAIILVVLGLLIKAVKWLLIIGAIALIVAIVAGVWQARKATR